MRGLFVAYWTRAKFHTQRVVRSAEDIAWAYVIPGLVLMLVGMSAGLFVAQHRMSDLVETLNDLDDKYFELAVTRHVIVREFIELHRDPFLCTHLPAEIRITEPLIEWFREAQWNALTDPLFPGYREDMTDEEVRAAYDAAFDKAIS
jgi:hypothetical protein